jgi:hypothetical protein
VHKVVEISSEDENSSDEDMTVFIKTFKKFVGKNDIVGDLRHPKVLKNKI